MTPTQALQSVMSENPLQDVIIVGYRMPEDGDDLFVRSSRMTRQEALWLAEQLKIWALGAKMEHE